MKQVAKKIASHDFIKLLSDRPYVFFLLSVVFSQVAFNMMNVVLIFLVFRLTSSNFLVSMTLLLSLLPQVFLSFLGGIIADSKNKKDILMVGNIARAVAIFLLFFFNTFLSVVYLIAVTVSVITQFYIPAETPIIPKIVPERLLITANSLFGLALFGSTLIGFVAAGSAITFLGWSQVFIVIAFLFGIAGFFANLIPSYAVSGSQQILNPKKMKAQVEASFKSYLAETYRLLLRTTGALPAFALLIISQVIIFILAIIVPSYAKDILHIRVEDVSLILFAPAGLGMIIAALSIGSVSKDINRTAMMNLGVFLSGIVLLSFPLMSRVAARGIAHFINGILPSIVQINMLHMVIVLAFLAGIGNAFIFIPAQTIIQEKIPENFRSKIYGLLFAMIGMFSLLPLLLAGGLADSLGVSFVLSLLGGIILLTGIIHLILMKAFTFS
ncbi:MAG: MFS transporter [Candidatus Levyibacteriota bacterium]